MRVLVTGATGFIGRALVERIAAAGHDVTALTLHPDRYHGPGSAARGGRARQRQPRARSQETMPRTTWSTRGLSPASRAGTATAPRRSPPPPNALACVKSSTSAGSGTTTTTSQPTLRSHREAETDLRRGHCGDAQAGPRARRCPHGRVVQPRTGMDGEHRGVARDALHLVGPHGAGASPLTRSFEWS